MKKGFVMGAALFGLLWALRLNALEEHVGAGAIQWDTLQFQTTGWGAGAASEGGLVAARKAAQKHAEEDALKNALASLALVQVDAQKNIGVLMREDDALKTEIERHAREFRVKDLVHYSDGAVKVSVSFSMLKLLPRIFHRDLNSAPSRTLPKGGAERYSGMLVVAAGLPFSPLLSPRIIAEDGSLVYSADFLPGGVLARTAPVAYFDSLEEAKQSERFGKTPLVIRAIRLEGRDALVVPSNEVRDLLEGKLRVNFLEEARVGVVLSGS